MSQGVFCEDYIDHKQLLHANTELGSTKAPCSNCRGKNVHNQPTRSLSSSSKPRRRAEQRNPAIIQRRPAAARLTVRLKFVSMSLTKKLYWSEPSPVG